MTISLRGSGNSAYEASPAASFPSAPVSGNLLVAVVADRNGTSTSSLDGTGWTKREEEVIAQADGTYRHYVAVFSKVAGASEPSTVTATTDGGGSSILVVCEFESDASETFTFLTSASANTSNAGTITSQTTGTTTSTSGAVACISVCGIKSPGSDITPWTTWTNSFTNVASYDGGPSVLDVSIGLLNSSATGTKETTASGTGTDRSVGAAILVFDLDGSSGDANVAAVTATATATAPAPTFSGSANVTGVAATSTSQAVAPTFSGSASVTAVAATVTATAIAPVVSGSGAANVAAVTMTATAAAVIPEVSGETVVSGGGAMAATMAMVAPSFSGSASVQAVRATANAQMVAPGVTGGSGPVSGNVAGVVMTLVMIARTPVVQAIDPTYAFYPPTHEEPMRTKVRPLNYYRLTHARSVVKVNGTYVQIYTPSAELLAGLEEGVDFFRGGYEYVVDRDTADALAADGFTATQI